MDDSMNINLQNLIELRRNMLSNGHTVEVYFFCCIGSMLRCTSCSSNNYLTSRSFDVLCESEKLFLFTPDYNCWLLPYLPNAGEFLSQFLSLNSPDIIPPNYLIDEYGLTLLADGEFGRMFQDQLISGTMLSLWGKHRQRIDDNGVHMKISDLESGWRFRSGAICVWNPDYLFSLNWNAGSWSIEASSSNDIRVYRIDREGHLKCTID